MMHSRTLRLVTEPRPATRGDCVGGARPCQWKECRHHLIACAGDIDVETMIATCALDVADRGGATLAEVATVFGLSRERVRQIEEGALATLKHRLKHMRDAVWTLAEVPPSDSDFADVVDGPFKAAVDRAWQRIVPVSERGKLGPGLVRR
jgi:hypothetical protein